MGAEKPLKDIKEEEIDDNDVLLGRGGKTNHHPGNASYLKQIEARELEYLFLESRTEKTEYAMKFVQQLRKQGIRFLKKDDHGALWHDVGDIKMREKVSQNLRERQPELKKQLAAQEEQQQQQKQPPTMQGIQQHHHHQQQQQQIPQQIASSMSSPQQQHRQTVSMMNMQPNSPVLSNLMYSNSSLDGSGIHDNNNNNKNTMDQYLQMQAMAQRNQQSQQLMIQQMMMQQQMQQQQQQMQQQMHHMGGYASNFCPDIVHPDIVQPMSYMGGGGMHNPNFGLHNNGANNNINNNMINNNNSYGNNGLNTHQQHLTDFDQREIQLLQGMNGDGWSVSPLNRGMSTDTVLLSPEEESRLRDAEGQPLPGGSNRPSIVLRGRSTDFGLPINDVPGMESFANMGCSTTSLLDTLEVDPVPEEGEGDGDVSPTPTPPTIGGYRGGGGGGGGEGQFTPIQSNRRMVPPLTRDNNAGPATVSPTPSTSPRVMGGIGHQQPPSSVLDDEGLHSWANSDGDDPFVQQPAGAKNRRAHSLVDTGAKAAKAPVRRMGTTPTTAAEYELSPRPGSLTIDKRATSNVAETPETRGHLVHREHGLQAGQPAYSDPSSTSSSSSTFSVKKASLGRDRSEQARLLKQQYMPQAYAANAFTTSASIDESRPSDVGHGTTNGRWMGADFAGNNVDPLTPPVMSGNKVIAGNIRREYTPRTYGMMQDFGKLRVSATDALASAAGNESTTRTGSSRTATSFEETFAGRSATDVALTAAQMPMDLMVKKPAPMTWRNRSTTMNALDLDGLDDDSVLQGLYESELGEPYGRDNRNSVTRSSINSIAGMWMNVPAEFDAFVSDIAGQPVSSFVLDLPTLGGDGNNLRA